MKKTNFVAVNNIVILIPETMMSLLKECRKRKKQDRLAREIAARHEMMAEYEAARKEGVSPVEILKDWDMVTEKDRKKLQEVEGETKWSIEDYQRLSITLTLVLTIFSLVALIISGITSYNANKTTKMVSSKEYQMKENLKFELLKVITELKSIESKIAVEPALQVDFHQEFESISQLRTSPGYLLLLHSIKSEEDRFELDKNMLLLINSIQLANSGKTLECIHNVLGILKDKADPNKVERMDMDELTRVFCEMKIIAPVYQMMDIEETVIFKKFIEYLVDIKHYTDPEVLLYYGKHFNDREKGSQAFDDGADTRISESDIINKYRDDYKWFVSDFNKLASELFVDYLYENHIVVDYDVSLVYCKHNGYSKSVTDMLELGANPDTTEEDIVKRYPKEYEKFLEEEMMRISIDP